MNVEQVARVMRSMVSGESRWIGSEGVHVYAFGSQVAGRFDPKALVFKVVADGRPYEGQDWVSCEEAAEHVAVMLYVVAMNEQADSRRVPAGDGGEGFQLEDEIMAKAKKVETKKQTKAPKVKATAKAPDSPPAAKARVAAKLTKAAVKAGLVEAAPAKKRPSIVAKEIIEREGLKNTSHQFEVENVVDHKGRQFWIVKVQGFFVAEFDGIAAAKKAYPNARILGGQGCAEAVEGMPEPVDTVVAMKASAAEKRDAIAADVAAVDAKKAEKQKAAKARVAAKLTKAAVKAGAIQPATYQVETERVTAAARETLDALKSLPKPEPVKVEAKPAAPATETPDERLARLKAAARKAWETRRAQGWKHPKAKVVSPLIAKIDAQLAQSKAHVKQARETFKAIDAKKAERKKAEAVIKRVEKREKAKRLGQPINGGGSSGHGIRELKRIMGQAIGLN